MADLSVDEQVEHVVTLSAHLQARLNPIELRSLEELGGLQLLEQASLRDSLARPTLELVQNEALQQLLVRYPDLCWLVRRTVLQVPILNERYVFRTSRSATAMFVRSWGPPQGDGIGRMLVLKILLCEERLDLLGELELIVLGAVRAKDYILV